MNMIVYVNIVYINIYCKCNHMKVFREILAWHIILIMII